MKKLILATRGKVFTAKSLDRLIESTPVKNFRTKWDNSAALTKNWAKADGTPPLARGVGGEGRGLEG